MKIQDNLHCIQNLKHIKQLHDAGIDHHVIAQFFQSENIPLRKEQIDAIVQSNDALQHQPISSNKIKAIMQAKADLVESEQFPCPV